ncbi:hypothetical protein Ddc_02498 [Ditylenchus destructor]|nr:hypothetical protein Ddc_02498 [Ditylenchus destructor]
MDQRTRYFQRVEEKFGPDSWKSSLILPLKDLLENTEVDAVTWADADGLKFRINDEMEFLRAIQFHRASSVEACDEFDAMSAKEKKARWKKVKPSLKQYKLDNGIISVVLIREVDDDSYEFVPLPDDQPAAN